MAFKPTGSSDQSTQVGSPLRVWLRRQLADPQIVVLGLLLAIGLLAVLLVGRILAPVIAAVVIAYILEAPTAALRWRGVPQFGLTGGFLAVCMAYLVIQTIDGNLLAPLLISEVVDLHPIAIIVSVLFFGGIWACGESSSRSRWRHSPSPS